MTSRKSEILFLFCGFFPKGGFLNSDRSVTIDRENIAML